MDKRGFTINYGNWNNIAWSCIIEKESFVRMSPHRERDVGPTRRPNVTAKHPYLVCVKKWMSCRNPDCFCFRNAVVALGCLRVL